jgi:peptidyl-prolyl cis-trans isomerase B (cyclophilin B)
MTTKKQAREQQRRRQAALERKIAERDARRARRLRIGAIVAVIALAGGGITALVFASVAGRGSATASDPSSTPRETYVPDATTSPEVEFATGWGSSAAPPDPAYAEARTWDVTIDTNQGPITVSLDGAAAPQAVASFIKLAGDGFFDRTDCHRLTTAGIYVLQCGDPTGTGGGGPTYRFGPIENAPADDVYPAGTIAMARQGNNAGSNGSQFFIVYQDSTIPHDSAGGYTVMGTVTDGLGIVEDVAQAGTITGDPDGRPAVSVIINEVTVE